MPISIFLHQLFSPTDTWSHRLVVQDAGLSRRKHGFESRWDHHRNSERLIKELVNLFCLI